MAATRSLDEINRLLAEAQAQSAELTARQAELLRQIAELRQEKASLLPTAETAQLPSTSRSVANESTQDEKIALFRSLFRAAKMSTPDDS